MRRALHPQAKFDPIPPDLDLHTLVDRTPNFDWVTRISIAQIRRLGPAGFEKLVQLHVIEGGRPLVIEGWDRVLPNDLFSSTWLKNTYDKKRTLRRLFLALAATANLTDRGKCSRYYRADGHSHDHWSLPAIHATAHKSVDPSQFSR